MALTEYKRKRDLKRSPEPAGGQPADEQLHFVVQKHKASHLHYDFRLELKGQLKSWAVPKGPSLRPADKRLAMQVEDHPYDYKDFEGIIPEGHYGAGTVMVWDEGIYEPIGEVPGKKEREQILLKQWKAGNLKFVLKGKKLKGEFALVKMKGTDEKAWLLMKHKDKYAKDADITQKDKSVLSGKTLEKIAASKEPAQWISKPANVKSAAQAAPRKKSPRKKKAEPDASREKPDMDALLRKGVKKRFSAQFIPPMLSKPADKAFDDRGWEYEVKWDGYRAMAYLHKGKVLLRSRNNKDFGEKFLPVAEALKKWKIDAIVDGEIVAVNEEGVPEFNKLQNWSSRSNYTLIYYVFDLLWLNGWDIRSRPLQERKALLKQILPENNDVIREGYSVREQGVSFFEAVGKLGLEGIMAKRSDSIYMPGQRTGDWLKIKLQKQEELIIGGYTRKKGSSKLFSSLLLGVYEQGKLKYAGRVGTGFNSNEQQKLLSLFTRLRRKTCPFDTLPDYNKRSRFNPNPRDEDVTWLSPRLVCAIHFTEITEDGVFRHPSYIALREDKDAKEVIRETVLPAEKIIEKKKPLPRKTGTTIASPTEKVLLYPPADTQNKTVNDIKLKLTNLNKIYWPEDAYTKRDMLNYYYQVSKYILPYLKDRPQSLNRFPDGIDHPGFYQKDITGKVPEWVEKFPYKVEGDRKKKHYMLCNNTASLLYMANLGAIEMHPWSSTIHKPDFPDWSVLDLDPDRSNTFDQVIQVARTIRDILEGLKIPSFCKTSGSSGLHIYIPLAAKYTYQQSQMLAKWVAAMANEALPFTSIERMTDKRKGKIYIDFLQNRPAATVAAPYSLRPKSGATVSMPLYWEEVKKGLKISDFTIKNAVARLQSEGDIFKPVLGRGINLEKILNEIALENT